MKELSVYIHIPFCERKCAYCDFVSFKCCKEMIEQYVQKLLDEINSFDSRGYIVDSIFFGGGTPTLLNEQQFESIVDMLKAKFMLSLKEFTIEGNPNSYTKEKVDFYKSQGVTRLSVGVQSLNDEVLKGIGRIHSAKQAKNCLKMLVDSGLDINCDMMVGLPYQSLEIVQNDFEELVNYKVKSVSCYSLILEEGTPLYENVNAGKISLPNEDLTVDMYELAANILQKSGLNRYEISNFGKVCLHNVGYWTLKEYVGFGLAAHSFLENTRYFNTSDLSKYIAGAKREIEEVLTLENMRKEYAMLSLRMESGINVCDYKKKFGERGFEKLLLEINKDIKYYNINDTCIAIKPKYIYMSNYLISNLI